MGCSLEDRAMKLPDPTLPNVRIPAGITSGKTNYRETSHADTKKDRQSGKMSAGKDNKRGSSYS
jgi:hypothetical protein